MDRSQAEELLKQGRAWITAYDTNFAKAWKALRDTQISSEQCQRLYALMDEAYENAITDIDRLVLELVRNRLDILPVSEMPASNEKVDARVLHFTLSLRERIRLATANVAEPKAVLINILGDAFPAAQPQQIRTNWTSRRFSRLTRLVFSSLKLRCPQSDPTQSSPLRIGLASA